MNPRRSALLFALLLLPAVQEVRAEKVFRVGVPPVQDHTGEALRQTYGQNLRRMLVAELIGKGFQAVFLNTGPSFDSGDSTLIQELAQEAGVDAVARVRIVAVVDGGGWKRFQQQVNLGSEVGEAASEVLLKPMRRDDIRRLIGTGSGNLVVEAQVSSLSGLDSAEISYYSAPMRRSFLKELADFDATPSSSRPFKDTGPGQAAYKCAKQIAQKVDSWLAASGLQPSGEPASAQDSCELTFGVRFSKHGRASRNYTVAINGKEVTYALRNGRVAIQAPSGLFQVFVTVQDAPYGLTLQQAYDANSFFECASAGRKVFLEIGSIGEASLKWEEP